MEMSEGPVCNIFQLTVEKKIDKHLLPPKKIIGKNSKSLVEKRQKELEVYLQTLLSRFPVAAPKVLSIFLHFHLYVSIYTQGSLKLKCVFISDLQSRSSVFAASVLP